MDQLPSSASVVQDHFQKKCPSSIVVDFDFFSNSSELVNVNDQLLTMQANGASGAASVVMAEDGLPPTFTEKPR